MDWSEDAGERRVGILLRTGVTLAAAIVLAAGVMYLVRYGNTAADYRAFHGEPENLRSFSGILKAAFSGSRRGMIQLGLLVLIATPVARVAFSAFLFLKQRDYLYLAFTLTVLAVLFYSL